MNYIHQLQNQIVDLHDQHLRRIDRIQEFVEHLSSPKFGPQADGSRGDWIATADVLNWLRYIEDIAQNHL